MQCFYTWQHLSLFIVLKRVLINLIKEFNPKNHTQVFISDLSWEKMITVIKHFLMGKRMQRSFVYPKFTLSLLDPMWVYFFLLSWMLERNFTRNNLKIWNFVPLNVLFFWKIELIISWICCLSFFSLKLFPLADYYLHLTLLQQDSAEMWACSFCFN